MAVWAFVGGIGEFITGFGRDQAAGTRAMFLLGGLVSIAFGVVLVARPDVGALTLALLFGLYSLIFGVSQIVLGAELRHSGASLRSVAHDALA